jgi:hypothetical protein
MCRFVVTFLSCLSSIDSCSLEYRLVQLDKSFFAESPIFPAKSWLKCKLPCPSYHACTYTTNDIHQLPASQTSSATFSGPPYSLSSSTQSLNPTSPAVTLQRRRQADLIVGHDRTTIPTADRVQAGSRAASTRLVLVGRLHPRTAARTLPMMKGGDGRLVSGPAQSWVLSGRISHLDGARNPL